MLKSGFSRSLIILTIWCLTATAPAKADSTGTPEAVADARAIVVAADFERTIDFMFAGLIPLMEQGFIGGIAQVDGGVAIVELIDTKYPGGMQAFSKRFGELALAGFREKYPELMEETALQYAAEIEPADLAIIRAFYESPSGKAMTAATPKIQQYMSQAGQKIGETVGEEAATKLTKEADQYFEADE